MASGPMSRVLPQLRRALLTAEAGPTDAGLLERFVARRDEAAFAGLVRRHGPMVFGVCRRVAGRLHDAEDAFQATFLVLARRAASIRAPAQLGAWLYGVAYRTARKARAAADRVRTREKQMTQMPETAVAEESREQEMLSLLDHVLSRLPDKYRTPVVLCELQGRSRAEVAPRLGVPEGTLSSRLATARRMLARRLGRHGPAASGAVLAVVLAREGSAPAAVSAAAVRAAAATSATGLASAKVVALTEGVMKAMLLTKLKIVAALVLASGFLLAAGGATVLAPGLVWAKDPVKAAQAKPIAGDGDAPAKGEEHEVNAPVRDEDWLLDFHFKNPRAIDAAGLEPGRKTFWYLAYEIINHTGQEPTFIPELDIVTGDKDVHHDETPSAVVLKAIREVEDPKGLRPLKTSVSIAATPIPASKDDAPRPVAGVAVWNDVDPECDRFSIYVMGLSNYWSVENTQVMRKALQLNFSRVGGKMQFVAPAKWVYRESKHLPPNATDELDDLRQKFDLAQEKAMVANAVCKRLEDRIRALEKEKSKEKPKPDKGVDAPSADASRVEGVVTKTADGLVTISIGDDAGVTKGMTLEVYRLNTQAPDQSKYLGRLRVLETTKKESVCKPDKLSRGEAVKVGDNISSAILGK